MSLEQSQREFIRYVYTPKVSPEQQQRVRDLFLSGDKPDPGNGMRVYRANLIFGMLQALKDTYPFCLALLGENNFNFLGREYIYRHPSTQPDLTRYGESLGDFLSGRPEIASWPYLADVARLEWALDRAFYAGHLTAKGTLTPSLSLVESAYGILEPFELFQRGGLEALSQNPFRPGAEALAVWAEEGLPRQARISPEEAACLRRLLTAKNSVINDKETLALLRSGWFLV